MQTFYSTIETKKQMQLTIMALTISLSLFFKALIACKEIKKHLINVVINTVSCQFSSPEVTRLRKINKMITKFGAFLIQDKNVVPGTTVCATGVNNMRTHLRSGDIGLLHNQFDIFFFYFAVINLQFMLVTFSNPSTSIVQNSTTLSTNYHWVHLWIQKS